MKKWLKRIFIGALAGLLIFLGVAFLRMKLVSMEVAREAEAYSAGAPLAIGETHSLEVLPLYDKASASGDLLPGHGVSYLIRTDGATILFDLGNNLSAASPSPLEQNMARLGVTLDEIDIIVISHRHPDHVGGNTWWSKKTFSLAGSSQPSLEERPIYIPEPMAYPASGPILSDTPARLAEGVATTGLLTYAQPFPIWLALPGGDEQALAVNVAGKGLVLITGCGHMGLEALLARAASVVDAPVIGVIGGLHYVNAGAQALQPQIDLLLSLDPLVVALSPHDSGPAALDVFARAFPAAYRPIQVGKSIRIQ
jgi:7,8-dihydropterin-6-yl-methyl-4-(beta-D-ribofuranosyl)aminobenzene 5'-phosphate synthase